VIHLVVHQVIHLVHLVTHLVTHLVYLEEKSPGVGAACTSAPVLVYCA